MRLSLRRTTIVGCLLAGGLLAGMSLGLVSCSTAPQAVLVTGEGVTGNDPPALEILEPANNVTIGRGDLFIVRWSDTDRDSNALISFELLNTVTNDRILLAANIEENDLTGPDSFTFGTSLVALGTYNLVGTIDDGVNIPVTVFAESGTTGGASQRVVLTVVEPGQGPQTVPPVLTVTQPAFNLSVAQEDTLTVSVQPTELPPGANLPFDPDSPFTLYILLDLDDNPNNDDPANPDATEIIVLQTTPVQAGSFEAIPFVLTIDLATIPPRADGEPYRIRATADDGTNPRVHSYAVGQINVVQLASGAVDLFSIGRDTSGARFYGFNPGANLGSSMSTVSDFDADGVDDFVLVAQFGNPRNFGRVGEAYLVYGQNGLRFGGTIGVNSISEAISGVVFEAPRIRTRGIAAGDPRTDGISDVSFVPDLTGDGRPEILMGLQHVHGAWEGMDHDPGDSDITSTDTTITVDVRIRQGEVQVTEADLVTDVNLSYRGVDDLTISSAFPNSPQGSDASLAWQDNGQGNRQWSLIKFKSVLNALPDAPANIDIPSITANLTFRVFDTGGQGTVHRSITDFDELDTFSTYAQNGGEPQPGIDYEVVGAQAGGLGTINGDDIDFVQVDVSGLIQQLVDGVLDDSANELRFIIVPSMNEEGTDATQARSAEFSLENDRPTLNITYSRQGNDGAFNCYPDPFVNNFTDPGDDENADNYFYAGGMALIINSQNRDNDGLINPLRLEDTVVSLELVGVEQLSFDIDSGVGARASNEFADPLIGETQEPDRISGVRIVAGGFDFMDGSELRQPPREGLFGQNVASIGDLNNDGLSEIVISAPRNELYQEELLDNFGFQSTHWWSTIFRGSIVVIPGANYNTNFWREKSNATAGNSELPVMDPQAQLRQLGTCATPFRARRYRINTDTFNVFAEEVDDMLGGASSAGDFNQDGSADILCGAPRNDRSGSLSDTGAAYILYGRNLLGDFDLSLADDPLERPPMLRIRGNTAGDQIGWRQERALDVNNDRQDDVLIASPTADFGGVRRSSCSSSDNRSTFNSCANAAAEGGVFSDDSCKQFDYDNDEDIDDADQAVFDCLATGGGDACCANIVDNGFVGIIFGGVFIDGDRDISQIATAQLPGVVFYGSAAGHRAGYDVSSAGDFNQDGFGDILIAVPGEVRFDDAGRPRLGVVYLIFGGTHLVNTTWDLARVGSVELPGIVFLSPYVQGRPNEAAPIRVAGIGDINNDSFDDIAIGNPKADFIDLSFPQGPEATDASVGRRRDAGDVYIIYGNNFGANRITP